MFSLSEKLETQLEAFLFPNAITREGDADLCTGAEFPVTLWLSV
jgi:hypothetical protein